MNKIQSLICKAGSLGLVGALTFGATNVAAEEFGASAAVSTAIAITEDTPLSFGNLFVTAAGDQTAGNWSYMVLNPDDGNVAVTNGASNPALVSLGGATPAVATLTGVATAEITISLPNAVLTETDPANVFAATGTAPVLTIEGGDPGVATFQLYDFTVGNEVGTDGPATGSAGEFTVTRDFGSTDISFSIGATIVTDDSGNPYQDGNYVGVFDVEAAY